MKSGATEFDSRRFLVKPWDGRKGPSYSRRFRVEFLGALYGQGDKFATLADHIARQDPGGIPLGGGTPNPHIGNATLSLESAMAYTARCKKLYSLIWTHVEDVDIRAQLEMVAGDGLAAWAIVEQVGQLPTTGLVTTLLQCVLSRSKKIKPLQRFASRRAGNRGRVNASANLAEGIDEEELFLPPEHTSRPLRNLSSGCQPMSRRLSSRWSRLTPRRTRAWAILKAS